MTVCTENEHDCPFMENPDRGWQIISEEHAKSPPKIVQFASSDIAGRYAELFIITLRLITLRRTGIIRRNGLVYSFR
ncbi:MAG: hypothetical protein LBS43_08095 [Prevotellaceae bacterium]|jgi:hypothetical protein|nr:hypothetical protein [Prevotellaceae bacterium]